MKQGDKVFYETPGGTMLPGKYEFRVTNGEPLGHHSIYLDDNRGRVVVCGCRLSLPEGAEQALATVDPAKLASVHRDAECYQAGWAAAMARSEEVRSSVSELLFLLEGLPVNPHTIRDHRHRALFDQELERIKALVPEWEKHPGRATEASPGPPKCECKGTGTTVGPSGFRLCAACYPQGSPAEVNRALAARLGAAMTAGVVVHGIDPLPAPHPIPDVQIVAEPTPQVAPLHCHGCTDDMCPGCCDCIVEP